MHERALNREPVPLTGRKFARGTALVAIYFLKQNSLYAVSNAIQRLRYVYLIEKTLSLKSINHER